MANVNLSVDFKAAHWGIGDVGGTWFEFITTENNSLEFKTQNALQIC